MTLLVGWQAYKTGTLPDIPENYYYLTLVLSGTYTAKRYLERDGGITPVGESKPKNPDKTVLNG